MKSLRLIFIIWGMLILAGGYNAYSEDSSSGVSVLGSTEETLAENKSFTVGVGKIKGTGADAVLIPNETGSVDEQVPVAEIYGSPDNSSSRLLFEIKGSKIGEVKVSQPVALPSEGVVMSVNTGGAQGFTIIRVDEEGKETQVLGATAERAIGTRLAKGVYKAYPQDPSGTFGLAKLTVSVQVGLVESKIEVAE